MSSNYKLNLQCVLDTTQVKQELQKLRQMQNQILGNNKGNSVNGSTSNSSNLGNINGLNSTLSRLTNSINQLNTAITKLNTFNQKSVVQCRQPNSTPFTLAPNSNNVINAIKTNTVYDTETGKRLMQERIAYSNRPITQQLNPHSVNSPKPIKQPVNNPPVDQNIFAKTALYSGIAQGVGYLANPIQQWTEATGRTGLGSVVNIAAKSAQTIGYGAAFGSQIPGLGVKGGVAIGASITAVTSIFDELAKSAANLRAAFENINAEHKQRVANSNSIQNSLNQYNLQREDKKNVDNKEYWQKVKQESEQKIKDSQVIVDNYEKLGITANSASKNARNYAREAAKIQNRDAFEAVWDEYLLGDSKLDDFKSNKRGEAYWKNVVKNIDNANLGILGGSQRADLADQMLAQIKQKEEEKKRLESEKQKAEAEKARQKAEIENQRVTGFNKIIDNEKLGIAQYNETNDLNRLIKTGNISGIREAALKHRANRNSAFDLYQSTLNEAALATDSKTKEELLEKANKYKSDWQYSSNTFDNLNQNLGQLLVAPLQDALSKLQAPNMENVNSLASQGVMINRADDASREQSLLDYQREQTDLQRQIKTILETSEDMSSTATIG